MDFFPGNESFYSRGHSVLHFSARFENIMGGRNFCWGITTLDVKDVKEKLFLYDLYDTNFTTKMPEMLKHDGYAWIIGIYR